MNPFGSQINLLEEIRRQPKFNKTMVRMGDNVMRKGDNMIRTGDRPQKKPSKIIRKISVLSPWEN